MSKDINCDKLFRLVIKYLPTGYVRLTIKTYLPSCVLILIRKNFVYTYVIDTIMFNIVFDLYYS